MNNLFRHPYTRVHSVRRDLRVSRPTAAGYLNLLVNEGLVAKRRAGRETYYINRPLVELFQESDDNLIG
ncbi:MAG: helix-turn-helix domain-containing protein [Bryobacterales bacterium]|nr:helix-turn-helix domain-containing protein [Bryobacterales bacterium]